MTKLFTAVVAVLVLSMGVAEAKTKTVANPPTDAQLEAFYSACVAVAPAASVLCTCKQKAAPKLVDSPFMDVIIASMKGKALDTSITTPITTTSPDRTRSATSTNGHKFVEEDQLRKAGT